MGGVALFAEEDFRGREVRLSLGAGTQRKREDYQHQTHSCPMHNLRLTVLQRSLLTASSLPPSLPLPPPRLYV